MLKKCKWYRTKKSSLMGRQWCMVATYSETQPSPRAICLYFTMAEYRTGVSYRNITLLTSKPERNLETENGYEWRLPHALEPDLQMFAVAL